MPSSTRFAVAAHMLAVLALNRGHTVTSEALAMSVKTNPAVVRRLLGDLSRAGLTSARLGKGGGAELARGPKRISLLEIFNAVEPPGLIAMPRNAPDPGCPVGRNVKTALSGMTAEAEAAFCKALAGSSLRDLVRAIKAAG